MNRYITNLAEAKEKIIDLYPKFKTSKFVADEKGWDNFVVKVDNKFIFRFSRRPESQIILELEKVLLASLSKGLSNKIEIPDFIYCNLTENGPFIGYKMIEGTFLTKDIYNKLSEKEKNNLAKTSAEFLTELHSVNISCYDFDVIEPISNYKLRYDEFKRICFKYLNREEQYLTTQLFEDYFNDSTMIEYRASVIHGDLSSDHILLTNNGLGIIDFGDLSVFDPAFDFTWAYLLDEKLYDKVFEYYKGHKDKNFKHRIKDFYVKIISYYGIVYGEQTNNQDLIQEELKNLGKYLFD